MSIYITVSFAFSIIASSYIQQFFICSAMKLSCKRRFIFIALGWGTRLSSAPLNIKIFAFQIYQKSKGIAGISLHVSRKIMPIVMQNYLARPQNTLLKRCLKVVNVRALISLAIAILKIKGFREGKNPCPIPIAPVFENSHTFPRFLPFSPTILIPGVDRNGQVSLRIPGYHLNRLRNGVHRADV